MVKQSLLLLLKLCNSRQVLLGSRGHLPISDLMLPPLWKHWLVPLSRATTSFGFGLMALKCSTIYNHLSHVIPCVFLFCNEFLSLAIMCFISEPWKFSIVLWAIYALRYIWWVILVEVLRKTHWTLCSRALKTLILMVNNQGTIIFLLPNDRD